MIDKLSKELRYDASKLGFNLLYAKDLLRICPKGALNYVMLELEMRLGSEVIIKEHRSPALTQKYRGRVVTKAWVLGFMEANSVAAREITRARRWDEDKKQKAEQKAKKQAWLEEELRHDFGRSQKQWDEDKKQKAEEKAKTRARLEEARRRDLRRSQKKAAQAAERLQQQAARESDRLQELESSKEGPNVGEPTKPRVPGSSLRRVPGSSRLCPECQGQYRFVTGNNDEDKNITHCTKCEGGYLFDYEYLTDEQYADLVTQYLDKG